MNWFKRFRPEKVDKTESLEAMERAQEAHEKAVSMREESRRIAASLRKMREDNHFAESIRRALELEGPR